jgi:hypothetical protein
VRAEFFSIGAQPVRPYIFSFFAAAQASQRRNFLEEMLGGFQ